MSQVNVFGTLGADVASPAGTLVVNYPAGFSRGNFQFGGLNAIAVGQNIYKAPAKCAFTFNAANITITNKSGVTWASGSQYAIQADVTGGDNTQMSSDGGTKMPRVIPWADRYLDLGSPAALNAVGLRAAAAVAAGGAMALLTTVLDVPRNITIASSGVDTARVFTISSRDEYGRAVVETITGVNAATVAGKKAHKSNISVSVDAACAGNISIGWGNVLGLPAFVVGSAVIVKELQDGAAAAAGTLVGGDTNQPTATTGDVRGTYVPAVAPDGTKGYGLWATLPDPGFLGADQFAG